MLDFNIVESTSNGERAYYVQGLRVDRPVWRAAMESEIKQYQLQIDHIREQVNQSTIYRKGMLKILDQKGSFAVPIEGKVFYRRAQREVADDIREMEFEVTRLIATIDLLKSRLED